MQIHWHGHSCFTLTAEDGTRIATDPFGESIGYPLDYVEAEAVTISHDHHDHNNAGAVQGNPRIFRDAGEHTFGGIEILGIESFHDAEQGAKRGTNRIFVFTIDGLRIAHLGDLGEMPEQPALDALGGIDVLLAPVGGTYTIGPRMACDIANIVKANVLIPMHFQTSRLQLGATLLGVDTLLSTARDCRIHRLNQSECSITRDTLGEDRVLVLTPSAE